MSAAVQPAPRSGAWRRALEGNWVVLTTALLATSLVMATQPRSWRRPVTDAFWLALRLATIGSLVAVVVAATVVGIGVVGQALFWLDEFGERDVVRTTLVRVLVREVAPVTVGLVMLGRSGLIHLSELARMRADGTLRVLRAEGLDPSLFLAMPLVLALGIATFCNAVVFTVLAVLIGYAATALSGLTVQPLADFLLSLSRDLGTTGVLILPLKSLLVGLVIGATIAATALQPMRRDARLILPHGFFRALIAMFVASALMSAML
ncbi:MAG: ABC transporter permease [Pseudomonadota bacterium]